MFLAACALTLTACTMTTTPTVAPSTDEPSITADITVPYALPTVTVSSVPSTPVPTIDAPEPVYVPEPVYDEPLLAPVYTFDDAIDQCLNTYAFQTVEQSDCIGAAIVSFEMFIPNP